MDEDIIDTGTEDTFIPPEFDWDSLPTDEAVSQVNLENQYRNWESFFQDPKNVEDFYKADEAFSSDPSWKQLSTDAIKALGDKANSFLKNYLYDPDTKKWNPAGIITAGVALKALMGDGDKPKSNAYQGSIPNLAAVQQQIDYNDPNRRPGSMGRQYFTNTQFVDPSKVAEAQAAASTQAQGILSGYRPAPAPAANPYAGKFKMAYENMPEQNSGNVTSPASGVASLFPAPQVRDKTEEMAGGGMAKGRYLQGSTDGMADKIPSSIDGKQKAALSHGEFVIPADVVSHLGNGNSDAGAKKLYEMMARVRKARTGNSEQGKKINPNNFMPGGQVGYAGGGIAHFTGGGTADSTGTTGNTGVTTPTIPNQGSSVAEGLSTWAGPYVSDYLGKGQALSNQPYQAYTGPLTAGASDLQQQQYAGLSDVAKTGYTPTQFKGGIFDASAAQQYMNPYLSAALDPQLQELRRQGQITNLANQAQATKMGAFGSSGSALMQTEGQRNTLDKMQEALGQGYSTAYDKAMAQYNADQDRSMGAQKDTEASRQFSAKYGLDTLDRLGTAGATQRDIEQQGITADKTQFEEAREFPYKQVQFQKSLLTGLPITTTDTTNMQSELAKISEQVSGLLGLYKTLEGLGQKTP
jgi:hypothetical protein